MSQELLKDKIPGIPGVRAFREQEPMAGHCTFRAGGAARYYAEADTTEGLVALIRLLKQEGIDWFLLGNGSNLLVSDEGYDGFVIRLGEEFSHWEQQGESLRAGAAVLLSKIASVAAEYSLGGLEFASGIPGTLGGALVMNAGAYGGEMAQVTESVTAYFPGEKPGAELTERWERVGEDIFCIPSEDLEFSYRHSVFKEYPAIALSAVLRLYSEERDVICGRMAQLQQQRREKQPLEYPSAGSTFKRPEGSYAGKLISDAGCKGWQEGDACVSEKHAGFIVNKGNATASQIGRLICRVQKKVQEDYAVLLEPEVILLGTFEHDE